MKTVTLTNDFHHSSTRINARWADLAEKQQMPIMHVLYHEGFDNGDESAKRAYRKVSRELCGIDGCTCGVVR